MRTYLFRYWWNGVEYALEIPADSEWEARARLAALQARAEYDGVLEMKIPAVTGSWLPRLIAWWKNL